MRIPLLLVPCRIGRTEADRLFDRSEGNSLTEQIGACFYVDRQVVQVDKETAESLKKHGFPMADREWTPDAAGVEKAHDAAR